MATDTAEPATRQRYSPDPTRNAWQIPLFLVGASVFVAAWQGWLPLGTPDPAADFTRDLTALRNAYEKVSPDREELKDHLARVATRVDAFPEHAVLGRFILGSGYARLAELTANLDEARGHWTLAKQHFDRIRAEELRDPSDAPRLAFRSAKARAAVGLPANTPVAEVRLQMAILANVPFGEEPGEAGRLQANLAMGIVPPDVGTAKEALTRYLTTTGIATPAASLARAKYMLGDVHFRRKEPDLARKWLEQIGTEAPLDVVAPARFLLAKVRIAENKDWLGAVRDLETVRANPAAGPPLKALAAYHLGYCKLNTLELDAAAKAFEEALKAEAPEGIAAAARLADLHAQSPDPARHAAAVDLLASVVKEVPAGKEFKNPLIRANEVRGTFEMAISALMKDGAYEHAVKAVDAYRPLAENGRDRDLRAEVLAAWATSLQKSGGDFKPRAIAAAEEYKAISAALPLPAAKADRLRRAASLYKMGGNAADAVTTLQEATKLQLPDSSIGPVWAELADALLAADRPAADVLKAFNEAMAAAGLVSTTTRYRLARQFADGRDPRLAPLSRELFRQIAQQKVVSTTEQEFHERALVELAHDHIRNANFPEAEVWLRKQLSSYPSGAEAPLARLLLGVCLIQRSSATLPSPPDAATAAKLRDEALMYFKQIVSDTDDVLKRTGKLGDREAWLRREANLRVLQTYLQMKKPNDLLVEADKLRDRHRNSVEELIILSLIYHAFKQKGDVVRERQIRDQMKELFDRLPPSSFTADKGEYSRSYWEKVWFTPEK
jgi:tetratricopeptide (TPR) repeat protein